MYLFTSGKFLLFTFNFMMMNRISYILLRKIFSYEMLMTGDIPLMAVPWLCNLFFCFTLYYVNSNPKALELLEQKPDKINWDYLSCNPSIYR